jgi:hypothetical protein
MIVDRSGQLRAEALDRRQFQLGSCRHPFQAAEFKVPGTPYLIIVERLTFFATKEIKPGQIYFIEHHLSLPAFLTWSDARRLTAELPSRDRI